MSLTTDTTRPAAPRHILALGVLSAVLLGLAVVGALGIAPEDADQGVVQRIFYFHVAVAIASMVAFGVGCVAGIVFLRRGTTLWDDIGVSSVEVGLVYSVLTIITGSIWAKGAWGVWWRWDDVRLVSFLLIILLYAAYFVLRGSAEPDRQARFGAVYAVFAFAAVPLSFYSVRIAQSFIHPVVFTSKGANMPGSMLVWFVVSLAGFLCLFATLVAVEVQQRRAQRALERLKRRFDHVH